ncbi:putative phosphomevalonate kinase [Oesophagostomum dentatum]|uniref:Phosphomevalonate kinase n=1 Tax=Oesophagostomum dentatum TaxID=61180 RepID=A0A0B1TG36_OESDE|nr:putative phosphomevalonate kinase [Oesophagostomum dentatum]
MLSQIFLQVPLPTIIVWRFYLNLKHRSTIPPNCDDDIVIISDCRRPTDIEYFQSNYRTLTVRIEASLVERERRGFVFVEGIDDMPSECGLDEFIHDMTIVNDGSADLPLEIGKVVERIKQIS